jgi:hypothetical protein
VFVFVSSRQQDRQDALEGVYKAAETSRLARVTIWGETDSLPCSRDRFTKMSKVAEKRRGFQGFGVTMWGGTNGLLLSRDRFRQCQQGIWDAQTDEGRGF